MRPLQHLQVPHEQQATMTVWSITKVLLKVNVSGILSIFTQAVEKKSTLKTSLGVRVVTLSTNRTWPASLLHLLECKPEKKTKKRVPPPATAPSPPSPPPLGAPCSFSNSLWPWLISPPASLFNLRLAHRPSAPELLSVEPDPTPLPRPSNAPYLRKIWKYDGVGFV